MECDSYLTESSCSFSCGCTWDAAGPCSGAAAACSGFSTQSSCNGQDGCGWVFCSSYECR
ncbi:MAG: hypothetical protein ABIJ56_09865 [Pseudomonadota bacterium]